MEHCADADAGTEISGAGGKVTDIRAEGVFELPFEGGIRLINGEPGLLELEAGAERLHAEMVLLIDHDAKGFVAIEDQAAAGILGGVFAANEMALDENLFVQRREIVHRFRESALHFGQVLDGRTNQIEDTDALGFFCPTREGGIADVSGEADATRHDDPVVRALATRAFSGWDEEFV
jgi:hypothetical protein